MRCVAIVLIISVCVSCASTTANVSPVKSEYVCTNRFFALPESFDTSSVEQSELLVKANPQRFEAHLILASALLSNKRIEEAVQVFKTVDKLASYVTDSAVLEGLQYEGLYAFTLFVAAERRFQTDKNDLYTLRMLQQVIGMEHAKLEEKGLLLRCYIYIATLYVKRGAYDSAIWTATAGQSIAKECGDTDSIALLQQIVTQAKALKDSQQDKTSVHSKSRTDL